MEHLYNLSVKNQNTKKWKNIARLYRGENGKLFLSFLAENDEETFDLLNGEFDRAVAEGRKYVNLLLFENQVYEEENVRKPVEPTKPETKTTRRQPAARGVSDDTVRDTRTTTRNTKSVDLDDEIPF